MRIFEFGRGEFAATRLVLAVMVAATAVSTVGIPLVAWIRGEALRMTIDTGHDASVPGLRPHDGAELEGTGAARVVLHHADAATWLLTLLPGVVTVIAVVLAAACLWRVLDRIQAGTPFDPTTVRHLRWLAGVGVVYAFLLPSLQTIANRAVLDAAVVNPGSQFEVTFGVQVSILLLALVCAALAQGFAVGARMQQDVEGLV